jgi:hypothetical protein
MPVSAKTDARNPSLVHLTLENVFTNGYAYTRLINDVKDLAVNKDEQAPGLSNAFATNSSTVTLVFNEPLDSLKAASAAAYSFDNGLTPINLTAIAPLFNKVNIIINKPIEEGIIYKITAKSISDCSGNIIAGKNLAKFGLSQSADSFDLVINEILFNPLSSGVDYVEIYNRSKKLIDLKQIYVANRNTSNAIANIIQLTPENLLLFPKEFTAVTVDPAIVKSQYLTFDQGNVILLNEQGNIIDEVKLF